MRPIAPTLRATRFSGGHILWLLAPALLLAGVFGALAGCAILGVAAQAMPPAQVQPRYSKLQGQSMAVMIWTEHGVRLDWPNMPLDLGANIRDKFVAAQKEKLKQLKDSTFPMSSAAVIRFQEDHPEAEVQPILEVAPQLGVSRLIYIEIQAFQTRSDASVDLFKGSALASIKVVEVEKGKATVAYQEDGVRATFPPKGPEEGIPAGDDSKFYEGTIDALSTEIVRRFLPYEEEQDTH